MTPQREANLLEQISLMERRADLQKEYIAELEEGHRILKEMIAAKDEIIRLQRLRLAPYGAPLE